MTKRNRELGKETERNVAKYLDGKRVGIFGGEDVEHPVFSIEVKSREKFVAETWYKQCVKNCPEDKIPLLIVHKKHTPIKNSYVVLRLEDFKELMR